ncbi:MAG: M48 family metalloprotease [Pseudomonadota bacterium]|jgi:Zn-dependent protease with chaperone function
MKRLAVLSLVASLVLSACAPPDGPVVAAPPAGVFPVLRADAGPPPDVTTAARNFVSVVRRMEPVIREECRMRARPGTNCDFRIVVDDRRGQPPNAYQTLAPDGAPIIAFTIPLIADARNVDELAFILGHEAAHHIRGHIPRQKETAMAGALILGGLVAASGGDPAAVRSAQDFGATVGARTYSKEFELEADDLGTVLAWQAGYDPLRGAAFFTRIPDPGNQFLGSHPPNAERIAVVRAAVARLQAGG